MANYSKTTNFATKDGLTTGNPSKTILGTEIDTEYNNIATAVNSKADASAPTFSGSATAVDLSVSGTLDVVSGGIEIATVAVTASAAELNKLDGATVSTVELNRLVGVTSAVQTQLDAKLESVAFADLTTTPTTLAGYGITDAASTSDGALAQSATQPGDNISTLTNNSGFISANQTITLSGDASGSGTTAITVVVADDSHSHTGSTISNLAAGDVTSGTFADARISASSVTQHQASINAGSVDGYSIVVDSGSPSGTNASTLYFVT